MIARLPFPRHQRQQGTDGPQNGLLLPLHTLGFAQVSFMVVPEEVQDPVNEQRGEFMMQREATLACLASRLRDRNHHVTEHGRGET